MSRIGLRILGLLSLSLFGTALYLSSNGQVERKANPVLQADYSTEAFVVEKSLQKLSFENDGTNTREATVSVRVQSDAGVQRFSVLEFSYQKDIETLEIRYVRVRKPDGSVVPTPLDEVQDMPSAVAREAPFYSDSREKHIPVKGLGRDDVLEFQCYWRQTKSLIPGQFGASVEFSRDDIVLNETVQFSVPRDRIVKIKSSPIAPTVAEEGTRRTYTWVWSNLEHKSAQKFELAQLTMRGRLPAPDIQMSSFKDWDEVGRWYDALQRDQIVPAAEIREKAAELIRNAPDDAAKLKAIYRYVSTDFRYIGIAFGIGRYQSHSAVEVLNNRYGDCKDQHTLLTSLLKAAGISAFPAFVNTSRVIDTDVPSPFQFDHVITVVPQGKEFLWLDTTTGVAPFEYLLPKLRGKPAFVISPTKAAAFETTPIDPPFPTSWVFKIDAKLDDSGTLEGKVEQVLRGDIEVQLRATIRGFPRTEWKNLVQGFSYGTGFAGEVSDVAISMPESTEKPLTLSYTYKRKDYPDWRNRRITAPAPNVLGMPPEEDGKLPSSLWLGAPGEFQFESRVELPQGWTANVPSNKDLLWENIEYHASYGMEGSVLVAHSRVVQAQQEVTGTKVRDYKAFTEKVHKDRDQFVPLSTGRSEPSESGEQAVFKLQNQVWELPDSSDPGALQAENDAKAAIQQGSVQKMMDGIKRAVSLDPKFTRAWILLGQMNMGLRQQEAGLDAFRKAIDSDPQQSIPYKMLAFALTSLDRRADAIRVWKDFAKVAPDDHDVPTNLGGLLYAEKQYHEAVPYLEKAVKLYPKANHLFSELVAACLYDGQVEKALGVFEELLKLDPDAGRKNDFAYQLAETNKLLDTALRYAQEAVREEEEKSRAVHLSNLTTDDLEHTSTLASYWDTLGWVHYRLGNLKEAESYLHAAWTAQQDPVVGDHLGQVFEKQLRREDAVRIYRLVIGQQVIGAEANKGILDAQKRFARLKVPPASSRTPFATSRSAGEELSKERTIALPRLVPGPASAEFYVLLSVGPNVEDAKFISGSDKLKAAGKALAQAHFKVSFPANSSARLVRRGILGCYPISGCSFVLIPTEMVKSVE